MGPISQQKTSIEDIITKKTSVKNYSPFKLFILKFRTHKPAVVCFFLLIIIIALAFLAPLLAPFDPAAIDYKHTLLSPSWHHLAGTDVYGRDIFSRLLYGARVSLSIGFCAVFIGAILGTIIGVMSGFFGGIFDSIVMRIADVLFAFPSFLLAIGIVAVLGPGVINLVIAIATFCTPTFARIARSSTLNVLHLQYITAARTMGASKWRIMFIHILPSTLSHVIVYLSMRVGTAILTAAGLSFLGLGVQPPSPEWGAMLALGRDYIGVANHLTIFPGICISVTVLACNVLGDGLRSALDPKA